MVSRTIMKTTRFLGLLAALVWPLSSVFAQAPAEPAPDAPEPAAAVATLALSPGAAEVVRLSEAGTSDEVVLAYVRNSRVAFELTADQILYLKDIGLTSDLVSEMLKRDSDLRKEPQPYVYDQKLYPATVPPPAPLSTTEPAPQSSEPPAAPVQPTVPAQPPAPAPSIPPVSPVYVSSPPPEVSYFYDGLSPYGTWIQLEGVGWCWQPRVVVIQRTWRPYCDSGHWLYTDAGWFWQSDYSWGWAPFHYGRWHLHDRCGWVWLPDRTWGPAWVTWRVAGDTCGWAPLPPHADFDIHLGYRFNGVHVGVEFDFGLHANHYTFIPLHDFHRHDLGHRRLPPTEVTRVYNHTTIVNNYVVNNNTIVNQGVKVDRVNAATRTQFRKVPIRDVPASSVTTARLENRTRTATPVAYRTELKAPSKPAPMVAQKVDARHPVIHNVPASPSIVERKPQPTPTTVSRPLTPPRKVESTVPNSQPPRNQPGPAATKPASVATVNPGNPSRSPAPAAPFEKTPVPAKPVPPPSRSSSTPPKASAPIEKARVAAPNVPDLPKPTEPPKAHPVRTGGQDEQGPAAKAAGGTYYPKTYHQAAETRVLPPANEGSKTAPKAPPGQSRKKD
jgi:hypothetical protein